MPDLLFLADDVALSMKTYRALVELLHRDEGLSTIVCALLLMLVFLAYLTVLTAIGQRSAVPMEEPQSGVYSACP